MAVHHDKLLKFLKEHTQPEQCSIGGNPKSKYNWISIGKDPASIAGAFKFLADEIEAGAFD